MKKRVLQKRKLLALGLSLVGLLIFSTGLLFVLNRDRETVEITPNQQTIIGEAIQDDAVASGFEAPQAVVEEQEPTLPVVDEPPSSWPVLLTSTEASSLTVVVNKKHKLPNDYTPLLSTASGATLLPEALEALKKLLTDAQYAGVAMKVLSSYRSYDTQVATYNKWVAQSGQAAADTFSARPGHSEHQLGLAADLGNGTCDLEICFGDTNAGKWLTSNAQNYGFIIRYPSGKDGITGYQYEPWHIRYVGNAAVDITASGKTLDEYYGIESGTY